ncbi:ak1 [Symbiodinium natans]|uniref:Ak1 protein n=1 Tax=Symbiodinium natans TaxID=878477 RepID=A0A812KE17_9DINO|nr:ak1 [Symbiodinium natans]
MGNRIVVRKEPSQGVPFKYLFGEQEVNAQDHGLKKVEFDPKPFDGGKFRLAYKGKVFCKEEPSSTLNRARFLNCWTMRRDADRPYFPCIVKQFRRSHAQYAKEWDKDLTVLNKAQDLARKFNKDVRPPVKIQFAGAFLYQVYQPGAEYEQSGFFWPRLEKIADASVQKAEKVCVEPHFEGKFVKANCNNGYVGQFVDPSLGELSFHRTAQAFSHWTWTVTEGALLVCDLQGVMKEGDWQFTDPAIHDAAGTQLYGLTDLGPRGINAFFRTHTCNHICQHMKKPDAVIDIGLPAPIAHVGSTTFSFELVQVSSAVHDQQDFADILDHAHRGTCYAQAVATLVRHAERRIVGRNVEPHHVIADAIVKKHGTKGGCVEPVLNQVCPPRRLRWREVRADDAARCLQLGRAVLCGFHLSDKQWHSFSEFFRRFPSEVLGELPDPSKDVLSGHGCVLIGQDPSMWKAKNSWGDDFGDGGYFRISKKLLEQMQARFFDIFFVEEDLSAEDREAYKNWCRNSHLHTVSTSS